MSRPSSESDVTDYDEVDLPDPVCEICGCPITEPDQYRPARDEGMCAP